MNARPRPRVAAVALTTSIAALLLSIPLSLGLLGPIPLTLSALAAWTAAAFRPLTPRFQVIGFTYMAGLVGMLAWFVIGLGVAISRGSMYPYAVVYVALVAAILAGVVAALAGPSTTRVAASRA